MPRDVIDGLMKAAYDAESKEGAELDFSSEPGHAPSITSVLSEAHLLGKPSEADSDVFQHGFDSLKVINLSRRLKSSAKRQGLELSHQITPMAIYENPTPSSLSQSLLRHKTPPSKGVARGDCLNDDLERMRSHFRSRVYQLSSALDVGHVVLLTGSTRSLGSYNLDKSIQDDDVSGVICMKRPGSTTERQAKINSSRGLPTDFTKVEFLETDLAETRFRLEQAVYKRLCGRVTHIIHNT